MTVLPGEIRALRQELQSNFRQGRWDRLGGALDQVAAIARTRGDSGLGIRAQGLRELVGANGGGRDSAGPRLEALFRELMDELDHLQWSARSRHWH